MADFFNTTFDKWSTDFFTPKNTFPGKRFQCNMTDVKEVKENNSWQGTRFLDDYKPWDKVNYDTIDWSSCFDEHKFTPHDDKARKIWDQNTDYVHWTEDDDIKPSNE